jgi:predicted PurR-regulated permease PerM
MLDVVRRRRLVFALVSVAVIVAVLVASRAVLLPFVLGLLLAYVLHPVVGALTRVSVAGRSVPRWVAVLAIYFTLVTTLVLTLLAITPRVVSEARSFALFEVPALRRRLDADWMPKLRVAIARVQGAIVTAPPREEAEPAAGEARAPEDGSVRVSPQPGGGFRVTLPSEGVVIERVDDAHWIMHPRRHQPSEGDTIQRELRRLGQGHAADVVRVGRGIIGGVIGGIFNFFMTLMVSAYLLVTEARVLGFLRTLVRPESRESFDVLLRRLDRGLSGVVRGQLIICLVNGSLSAVGFALADLKYWPTLAIVATVFSLIPIFGTVLSSVPAVAIALTQSFGTALFVLLWIIGIHQLEANLLNPKIMGDQAKIHPVLVVFSLLAGEHAFGILGALLAVPAMSIAQTLFLHWRSSALGYGEPSTDSIS